MVLEIFLKNLNSKVIFYVYNSKKATEPLKFYGNRNDSKLTKIHCHADHSTEVITRWNSTLNYYLHKLKSIYLLQKVYFYNISLCHILLSEQIILKRIIWNSPIYKK